MLSTRWIVEILCVAIAYALAGRFGLLFAVPPGYATPIWPASGIALACTLLLGHRIWPGIVLGSFLVNVWTGFETDTLPALASSLVIPIAIGIGAALQAVVGSFLIRRFAKFPNLLVKEREILSFLFWGATSCVVNSVIGVMVLLLSNKISLSNFVINVGTWWIGDTMGVFVFSPILLMLQPYELFKARRMMVTVPMVIAFMLTITLVNHVASWERERLNAKFSHDVTVMSGALEKSLNNYHGILRSLQSFYAASQYIDRQEFRTFAISTLAYFPWISALSWNPRIPLNRRAEFERATRAEGYPDFSITEIGGDGQLIVARERPEYVSVHYLDPYQGNEKALGYDVASQADRREALEKARDSGQFTVTRQIKLVQDSGNQLGILAFMPIYHNHLPHETLEERRQNLAGYMVAILHPDDILGEFMEDMDEEGVIHQLFDHISATENDLLFKCRHEFGDKDITAKAKGIFSELIPERKKISIWFGGRHWQFDVSATQEYVNLHYAKNTWLIVVFGFLVTTMVEVFVMLISGREILLKRAVDERTNDLSKTKELMEAILSSVGEGIYGVDTAKKIMFANPVVTKIIGWEPNDLIQKNSHDLLHHTRLDGSPYPQCECLIYSVIENNIIQHVGNEILWRKDGTSFPVEYTSAPIVQRGEITGAVVVFRDVTEQQRINDQLNRNHEILACIDRLQNLFISEGATGRLFDVILADILTLTGSEYGFIYQSSTDIAGKRHQRALAISNVSWNDETRQFYKKYVPSEFRSCEPNGLNAATIITGNDPVGDPHGHLPTGHPPVNTFLNIPLHVRNEMIGNIGLANRSGGYDEKFVQYLQPAIDVVSQIMEACRNERRRSEAERELQKSNARFDDLVSRISIGVYIFCFRPDGKMGFEYVSPRFCEILGIDAESVLRDASLAFSVAHPDDRENLIRANDEASRTLAVFRWEGRFVIRGETRYLRIESNPTPMEEGSSRWNGIITDITEPKVVEKKLRDESRKNETLLSMASDGIHLLDNRGNLILFSDSFARTLGYSHEEVTQLNVTDWDVSIPKEQIIDVIQQIILSPSRFETKHRRKDGVIIDVEINATGIEVNGQHYLYASSRDVTERKQAEAALVQSEQRFRSLFENMQTGFVLHEIITDPEGHPVDYLFLLVNDAYIRITGFDPQDLIGRRVTEVYPGVREDTIDWIKFYGEIALLGGHRNIESYSRGLDRWFDIIAYSPQPRQFAVLVTDITIRKKTEEALQRSEERLILATQAANIGIWDLDLLQDVLIWDDTMLALYGIGREDFSNNIDAWLSRLHPEDRTWGEDEILNAIQRNKHFNSEFRVVHPNGAIRHIKSYAKIHCQDQGTPIRILGVNWDITEQKQIEEEVLRSNRELEQFGYSISHDMRQPLRMISSYLQLIQMSIGKQLDNEQREYLHFATDGAKRLDAMLLGLLEYSRIGRKGDPPVWVESRSILDDALLFLGPAITEANANLRIEGEWPKIFISYNELLRLMQNLIANALKFRLAERIPEVLVSSAVVRNRWQWKVIDNGIGIPPDQIGRLFQVFQRLQSRALYEGTGIGLALCRKIVEHYEGRIGVESAGEGQGCTFWVDLPILDDLTEVPR